MNTAEVIALIIVPLAGLIWGLRVAARRARIIPPPVNRASLDDLMHSPGPGHPACRSPLLPDRMPPRPVGVDGPPSVPLSQLEQVAFAAIAAELRRAARERANEITGES